MIKDSLESLFRKSIIKRGYPSFWVINSLGWIIFIALDTFIVSPEHVLISWHAFIDNTLQWTTGYFSTIVLRAVYKKFPYRDKSLIIVLLFTLFCSLIASFIMYVASHFIYVLMNPIEAKEYIKTFISYSYIAFRFTQILPLVTTWSLLYFGIKLWLDWSREHDRAEKLGLMAQNAQLQMLRYQVNPHFLFNSFSSLRALIRSNQSKAEEMVSKLSEFYRYSLTLKNNTEVPLVEEINAVEHFFEIEKIRFGSKFQFNVIVDSLAEEYPVPCFLIHPLAENAIKYGMQTSKLPLKIKIDAFVKNNNLIICIANSGKWVKENTGNNQHGTNTGLSNVRSRLEYSFPNNHKISIKEEEGFVKIIIEIYKELK
ncbi:MAG: histidine kinase [Ignavibacteriaceae bacterium]